MSFLLKTPLLLLIIFVGFSAKSQEQNKTILSRDLPGTWFGILSKNNDKESEKVAVEFIWRIHSIDTLKKQVVLTEIGQHLQDGSDIIKPKKMVYHGTYNDSTFVIEFDKQKENGKLKFKFKRNKSEEMITMKGSAKNENETSIINMYCSMAKINNDTSLYVKPNKANEIQVLIAPPPPVEH